jgi:hypothetical protein
MKTILQSKYSLSTVFLLTVASAYSYIQVGIMHGV